MVKMKTAMCRTCGGIVFQLAGPVSNLCHDNCVVCRRTERKPDEEIYHTSDRPTTVREQYEAAWREKQSLR